MSEPLLLNSNNFNEKASRTNSINSVESNYSIKGNLELFEAIENEDDYKIRSILENNRKAKIWTYLEDNQYTILHRLAFRQIDSQNYKFFNIVRDILSFVAIQFNQKEKAPEFLKFINFKTSQGYTAMHYAAFRGNIFLIELLHEYKADINCLNNRKLSIVHLAAQGNSPMTFCYIRQKFPSLFPSDKSLNGINLLTESSKQLSEVSPLSLEAPDQIDSTPLHWACYSGSESVVTFLLSWKANPNIVDKEGLTPMHLAVLSEKVRIVKKLLQYGADKSIRDKKKRTPYDIAVDKKHKALMEILKEERKSCYFCVVKVPNQKIQKSLLNVVMFFLFNFFSFLCTFLFFLPVIKSCNDEISSIIYYSFAGVIMFIYLILLASNSRAKKTTKRKQEYEECINDAIENKKYDDISTFCPICIIKKKKNMRHCFICDECIDGFDHHCYWINKCVGKKNYWLFSIFIVFLTFYLGYCTFLFIKLIFILKEKNNAQWKFFSFLQNFLNNKTYIIWILGCINGLLIVLFLFPVAFLLCLHARNIIYNCRHQND